MTQKPSLILDKEFIQYCKLNKIDDIEKLAKETFKRGFDLLKYGNMPEGELTEQDKGKLVSDKIIPVMEMSQPDGVGIKSKMDTITPSPEIIEAIPMNSSNGKEVLTRLGVKTVKKKDLYDE